MEMFSNSLLFRLQYYVATATFFTETVLPYVRIVYLKKTIHLFLLRPTL